MVYYDIHTHHLPVHPEDAAIVNSLVPTFDVETGLFRSVGIHPWYIYNVEEQLAELKRQVSFPDVVAIGETGLDKVRKLRWTVSGKSLGRRPLLPKMPASF